MQNAENISFYFIIYGYYVKFGGEWSGFAKVAILKGENGNN